MAGQSEQNFSLSCIISEVRGYPGTRRPANKNGSRRQGLCKFAVSSAVVRNSLPTVTAATFAKHLNTYLFSRPVQRIWYSGNYLFCAICDVTVSVSVLNFKLKYRVDPPEVLPKAPRRHMIARLLHTTCLPVTQPRSSDCTGRKHWWTRSLYWPANRSVNLFRLIIGDLA